MTAVFKEQPLALPRSALKSKCNFFQKKNGKHKHGFSHKNSFSKCPNPRKRLFSTVALGGPYPKEGHEKLYPGGAIDEMPDWITELVIKPIEEDGMVPQGWINSAVVGGIDLG